MNYRLTIHVFSFKIKFKSLDEGPESLDLSKVAKVMDQFASLTVFNYEFIYINKAFGSHQSDWKERPL
jgi:hypothetical protein